MVQLVLFGDFFVVVRVRGIVVVVVGRKDGNLCCCPFYFIIFNCDVNVIICDGEIV